MAMLKICLALESGSKAAHAVGKSDIGHTLGLANIVRVAPYIRSSLTFSSFVWSTYIQIHPSTSFPGPSGLKPYPFLKHHQHLSSSALSYNIHYTAALHSPISSSFSLVVPLSLLPPPKHTFSTLLPLSHNSFTPPLES